MRMRDVKVAASQTLMAALFVQRLLLEVPLRIVAEQVDRDVRVSLIRKKILATLRTCRC